MLGVRHAWRRLHSSIGGGGGGGGVSSKRKMLEAALRVNPEVQATLESEPCRVVALETAVVSHGLPYPANLEAVLGMEDEIRIQGGIPATICVMDGEIHVGCSLKRLERLGKSKEPRIKVSRRDFANAVSHKLNGGTTVAGTLMVAKALGIQQFATGGIGGVHRGGESSFDVSADLMELGRSPVAVISAGVKSILDVPRTLEYLVRLRIPFLYTVLDDETQGVFVATLAYTEKGNPKFPNFFECEGEIESPAVLRGIQAAADLVETHFQLGIDSGLLIAVPVPEDHENKAAAVVIAEAAEEAEKLNIRGRDVTPFILNMIREKTDGSSVITNVALLLNNARIAGRIASLRAEHRLRETNRLRGGSSDVEHVHQQPVVVGAAALDFLVKVKCDLV
ncbi:unnamed protein product, partial [Notodromas monacha]